MLLLHRAYRRHSREDLIHSTPQVTSGRPLPFVDTLGNVLAIPNKLMFLTADFESHTIGPEVAARVEQFIDRHQLYDVRVRLNEYAPLGELVRLMTNRRVSLLLRLTFGPLIWLAYVLNIGRLFGGDHYNAFSNTVNLYSNHVSIALHEVGHALDFRERRFPGLYALLRFVPGVALYQEYLASLHAIEFLREEGDHEEEVRAYRVLFPAYSTYVFGTLIDLFPSAVAKWALFPIIAIGHALGAYFANQRLAAIGDHEVTIGGQWVDEKDRAVAMFSPATRDGRGQWGVLVGIFVGSSLCGPAGLIGAILGFVLARGAPDPSS